MGNKNIKKELGQYEVQDLFWLAHIAGRPVRLPVRGGSMWPLFRDGDTAIVVPVEGHEVRVGDIVVARLDRVYVMHRCSDLRQNGSAGALILRGDGRRLTDPPVTTDNILGIVVARERKNVILPVSHWLFAWGRLIAFCVSSLLQMPVWYNGCTGVFARMIREALREIRWPVKRRIREIHR